MTDAPYGPQPIRRQTTAGTLLPVAILVLAAAIFWYGWRSGNRDRGVDAGQPRTVAARGDLAGDEMATVELFEKASPSVVYINTYRLVTQGAGNEMEVPSGTGSGIVWDKQGHIVTNFHVTHGPERTRAPVTVSARVTLWDGSMYEAKRVGEASDYELAVWRIDAPADKLQPVAVGSSRDLRVGQKTFAIGNPFGWDFSLTSGIVSALDRKIRSMTGRTIVGAIQTDAAINPGNSGGPLLDSAGRLIGVNTAIISPSGTNLGIGFAIPVDTINRIAPQLIAHGKVVRPRLGVEINEPLSRRMGLERGLVIFDVVPGTGAAAAGLRGITSDRLGDVIIKVGDAEIKTADDLATALDSYKVGDSAKVTVLREGKEVTVSVKLQAID